MASNTSDTKYQKARAGLDKQIEVFDKAVPYKKAKEELRKVDDPFSHVSYEDTFKEMHGKTGEIVYAGQEFSEAKKLLKKGDIYRARIMLYNSIRDFHYIKSDTKDPKTNGIANNGVVAVATYVSAHAKELVKDFSQPWEAKRFFEEIREKLEANEKKK